MLAAGEAVYLLGRFDSARTLWLSALADARARRDSALEGRLLTWLGLAAYRTGDYARASRLGEQALQLKLRAGLSEDLAQSYNALGLLAWNQGRLAEAAGLFRQAAEVGAQLSPEGDLCEREPVLRDEPAFFVSQVAGR